jgi:hypothetical protein
MMRKLKEFTVRKSEVFGPRRWKEYQVDDPRYGGVKKVAALTEAEAKDELCVAMDLINELQRYARMATLTCEEYRY